MEKVLRSKSQLYSDIVFKQVEKFISEQKTEQEMIKRYKPLCKRAGGIMRTVGLIQFLTYLAAKGAKKSEVHHKFLLEHLAQELIETDIVTKSEIQKLKDKDVNKKEEFNYLLTAIRKQDLHKYMQTTHEVLKFLQWHKRIAEVLISGTAEDE